MSKKKYILSITIYTQYIYTCVLQTITEMLLIIIITILLFYLWILSAFQLYCSNTMILHMFQYLRQSKENLLNNSVQKVFKLQFTKLTLKVW